MKVPDPTALRFAELYAKALDKLGDPRPPQRVGALHTLELLGHDFPQHIQAIVDVFCAYLRMPSVGDGAVRQTAQRMLADHLRPGGSRGFWAGVSLDLTSATLSDLDLSGCRIDGYLRLEHAVLLTAAKFRGLVVGGPASVRGSTFRDHAWFERCAFHGPTYVDTVMFEQDAWFGASTFAGPTTFQVSNFGGHAWFGGATFHGPVDFSEAVFHRSAGFRGATLAGPAGLRGTTFLGPARVSRRGEGWNVTADGWGTVVDPDNESVGQLLWLGHRAMIEPSAV